MGIFNRKKEIKQVAEPENKPEERGFYFNIGAMLGGSTTWNNDAAMTLSAFYCGVNQLGNTMGSLPLYVEKMDENGVYHRVSHPLSKLLNTMPDKRFNHFNFYKSLIELMILTGNGYVYIKRDGNMMPKELLLLNPAFVQPLPQEDGTIRYLVDGLNNTIPASDMIHIFQRCDEMHRGISVLTYARQSLESAKSAEKQAANFYKSGANLNGIIYPTASYNDEQKRQIINSFASTIGSDGIGVALLPPGWKYEQIGVDPEDAELLSSRKWSIEEIARWLNIPPSKLMSFGNESYNSLEYAQLNYLQDSILPLANIILAEFNLKLWRPSQIGEYRVNFEYSSLLASDKKSLANYYQSLIVNGICTVNEARSALGMEPSDDEGCDKHFMQISYSTIDLISSGAYVRDNAQSQVQKVDNNQKEKE